MAQITIKDIKTGATVGTLERPDILDLGDKVRMPDGTDKFVMREELTYTDTERQTVYVGDLPERTPDVGDSDGEPRRPQKTLTIDLGHCDGWTLQSDSAAPAFVRCVSDAEADAISEAAAFCRQHATNPTYKLLHSSYRIWKQTYDLVAGSEHLTPDTSHDLIAAFVAWVLVWKLVLDQTSHELSTHFGRHSQQREQFVTAYRSAHARSQAYRLADALRGLVQHREIPPITLSLSREIDKATRLPVSKMTCSFPVSCLLNDPESPSGIKREFRSTPDATFELSEVIDAAMEAMNGALVEAVKAWIPELNQRVLYLRKLFKETAPAPPLLLRPKRPLAGSRFRGLDFDAQRLADLTNLVLNAPIAEP